ncbi:hypothetical protein ABTD02_13250 [Acinetobacter baumannii]
MTVQVSDRLSQLYVGNGVNTRFDFMFRAYEQEDETGIGVRVKVGNDFEFIEESEYAVTFNPDNMGGYVTFVDPPSSETFFYIAGKTPVDQLLDITNYDNFYPDAIERALDKLTAILQEWKHLVDFETQARILADIDYDQLAIQREADLKAYIDGIASSITGQPVLGLPSKFVVDGSETQEQINDKNIRSFESIADLLTYTPRKNGQIVYVKSTFSNYVYDSTKSNINNEITIINGWVLQQNTPSVVDVYQAGFLLNGSDEAAKVQAVLSLNLKLKIPAGTIVYSSTFDQTKIFGEGTFYFLGNVSDTQWSYSPSRALRHDVPTEKPEQKVIETTANWESASALSLLVNQASIDRAQLSGVQSKSQHLGLRFTDTTGIYVGVLAKRHSVLTNCTYTSNSVTSNDIVAGLNISAGEFLGVVTDATTWHLGLVDYVDFPNKKIFVKAWWNTLTKVEETPTVSTCYGPYTNAIWGQNTNVYLQDDRPAHSAIGYELGVRDRRVQGFTSRADGYLAVNLDGTTQKTLGSAFITSGLWRFALNAINIERAAVNMEITASTQTGLRVNQSTASNFVGKIIEATRGDTSEVSFYIDAYGRLSRSAQEYRVISGTTTHNALQFSLVLGANATGAHTTTINTVGMRPGHILEFRQLQALDWSIIAGGTTYVLNTSGTLDYLKLLYDGTTFIKILAAKSL